MAEGEAVQTVQDRGPAAARPVWRSVAIPTEHGGWGLTAEPVLLGLLVAPSWAGAVIGLLAFVAFLARTPLKLVLVDHYRRQRRHRTRLAAQVALGEIAVISLLVAAAASLAAPGRAWLVPLALAAPLVALELWFDLQSRSRRLAPELAGSVAMASVAASIALAGGERWSVALAIWLVLAGRSVASIPYVRVRVARGHRRRTARTPSDLAQLAGVAVAAAAMAVEPDVWGGTAAVALVAAVQLATIGGAPRPAKVLGIAQVALGLTVVAAAAITLALG